MQQNWQRLDPSPSYIRYTVKIKGKERGGRGGGGKGNKEGRKRRQNGRKREARVVHLGLDTG